MSSAKKSKTNVTGRGVATRDPRPKAELVVEAYVKPNGHIGLRKWWNPINQNSLDGS